MFKYYDFTNGAKYWDFILKVTKVHLTTNKQKLRIKYQKYASRALKATITLTIRIYPCCFPFEDVGSSFPKSLENKDNKSERVENIYIQNYTILIIE